MMAKNSSSHVVAFLLLFALAIPAMATEYYVDHGHLAADDQNTGSIGQPWKTIAKANQTLRAGDTVYIKTGTYNTYISPNNSGTPGSPITYRNYDSDVVTISGTPYAIRLDGKSYIIVRGLHGTKCVRFLYIINGSSYNTIAYSTFDQASDQTEWDVSLISGSSQYNWIHHSQFSKGGQCSASGSDDGQLLDIGTEGSAADLTRYNLIENSTFFHGGHHLMGVFGSHNTIRNNYFHNEAWSKGRGNRTLYLNGTGAGTGYNTIEGNRFGYAAQPCDAETVGVVAVNTPYNLIRYNSIYHGNAYGLGLYSYSGYSQGSHNRIYNNTLFNNGWNIAAAYKGGMEDSAVSIFSASQTPTGNAFKNNLYYSNYQVYAGSNLAGQTYANEFNGDSAGNPLFVDASTTPPLDKTDATLPNLDLQATSPAINKGGALTTVSSATGSGIALAVADATYFQDGTRAPPGTVQPDWIAVGTVTNVAQISSISANILTLASPISWTTGAPVWLYKKSDGVQMLYGSAPDVGAYEFSKAEPPSAPTHLTITP